VDDTFTWKADPRTEARLPLLIWSNLSICLTLRWFDL
jgi:hypothetical protein